MFYAWLKADGGKMRLARVAERDSTKRKYSTSCNQILLAFDVPPYVKRSSQAMIDIRFKIYDILYCHSSTQSDINLLTLHMLCPELLDKRVKICRFCFIRLCFICSCDKDCYANMLTFVAMEEYKKTWKKPFKRSQPFEISNLLTLI